MNNSFSNQERAEVLTQALPYIKRYTGKIVVVKYGGNAMVNENLKQQVMEDVVFLWLIGVKVVLVHGGGPEISDLMKKLGKKLTRKAVIVCAVLCMLAGCCGAVVNTSRLVAQYNRANITAAQKIQDIAQDLLGRMSDAEKAESADAAEIQNSLANAELMLNSQTTAACVRSFPQFLKLDVQQNFFNGELIRMLGESVLWILLSVVIGSFLTVPKLLRADSGEHQLVPLQSA